MMASQLPVPEVLLLYGRSAPATWTFGFVAAMVDGESRCHYDDGAEVSQTLMPRHQKGKQQEVVDEEKDEKDDEAPPFEEHIIPLEIKERVAECPQVQTQRNSSKDQPPKGHVQSVFRP